MTVEANFVHELHNPFATCCTQPGALDYLWQPGTSSWEQLFDRLRQSGNRGQIIGPHGSGKTTLLCSLQSELQRRGHHVELLRWSRESHRAQINEALSAMEAPNRFLLIDSWEQAGCWTRTRIAAAQRRGSFSLIVATHREFRLPCLWRTSPTLAMVRQIVVQLAGVEFSQRWGSHVEKSFQRHTPNIRELFFDLYDLYEQNRRCGRNSEGIYHARPPGISYV